MKYHGIRYEILFQEPDFMDKQTVDPIKTKLSALKLTIGDNLSMEYDYGAGWEFTLELTSITEMKRGSGTHYPYITAGKGKGIIEDISPYELYKIIEKTDQEGVIPKVFDVFSGKEKDWDHRCFDLEYSNFFFKDNIFMTQNAYERFE